MYFLWELFDLDLTFKRSQYPTLICTLVGLWVLHNIHKKQMTKGHYGSFVPLFNIAILKIFQSPVTLRIMSRSNGWYGTKVLVRTIIWHIEKNLALKNLLIISKLCSHWNTLEKWTLAYKIGLIGHTDLISGRWCEGHLKTYHVWFKVCISSSYDLCLVNGLTDGRMDGCTDARQQRVT